MKNKVRAHFQPIFTIEKALLKINTKVINWLRGGGFVVGERGLEGWSALGSQQLGLFSSLAAAGASRSFGSQPSGRSCGLEHLS